MRNEREQPTTFIQSFHFLPITADDIVLVLLVPVGLQFINRAACWTWQALATIIHYCIDREQQETEARVISQRLCRDIDYFRNANPNQF